MSLSHSQPGASAATPLAVRRAQSIARALRRRDGVILLFVAPALLLYGVYILYPVVISIWYSLLQWNGIGAAHFIGLDNWARLFHDGTVLGSLRNTLVLLVGSIVVEIPIGLGVALLLQRLGRLGTVLSSIYIVPLLMSSVAIGIIWGSSTTRSSAPSTTSTTPLASRRPAYSAAPPTPSSP